MIIDTLDNLSKYVALHPLFAIVAALFAMVVLFFHCLIVISLPMTFVLTIVMEIISFIEKILISFNKPIGFLEKARQKIYKIRLKFEYAFILEDVVDDD